MLFWNPGYKKKKEEGPIVDLIEEQKVSPSFSNQYVRSIVYGIYLHHTNTRIGNCDIRLGHNDELYYAGNIGYHINPPYRGHSYAYDACQILFEVARKNGMTDLIITCSPDNIPSRCTLERLNGQYVETVNVPKNHWLYKRGETVKEIYRYNL